MEKEVRFAVREGGRTLAPASSLKLSNRYKETAGESYYNPDMHGVQKKKLYDTKNKADNAGKIGVQ
jgi:hypothetical protein